MLDPVLEHDVSVKGKAARMAAFDVSSIKQAGVGVFLRLLWVCFLDGFSRLWKYHPTHGAGFASSVMCLGLALAIVMGWSSGNLPIFRHVTNLIQPSILVFWLVALGLTHLFFTVVIRTNRHVFTSPGLIHFHRLLSLSAFALWSYLALIGLTVGPMGIGVVIYGALAVAALWEFLRTGE
jgi:hypothetical protein